MRDYAKKASRPAKKKNAINGIWPLALAIIGIIFFVGYVGYHFIHEKLLANKGAVSIALTPAAVSTTHTLPAKTVEKVKKTVVKTAITDPTSNEPKYDFYKILPAMTVTIPVQAEPGKTLSPTTALPTTASEDYVLQIASLQTPEDANQVSNALKTSGYPTFIQHYQASDHSTWYRVMVGPFKSLKEAEADQTKLYAHQTTALLLKMQR